MPRVPRLVKNFVLALLCLLPALLFAHQDLPGDLFNDFGRFTETDPPAGPVRPIAEFEPASHVLIRYPLGIPVSLVAQLANTAQVVCIVSSATVQNQATTAFTSGGVNMANVSFLIAATDSYWTRDYGPWFIFDGNDNYGVVDYRYNRPRPNDNLIPQVFANQNGLDYYGMSLYQTGGNYMTDGINTAAQTTIAYSENSSLTQAQVNARMQAYMGITSYHVLPDPNNTYIDHIDCWGKFLAPDKVLIRSVPTTHAQYNAIEQTAAYFANLNCAWGYPYKVYRVNTPQNQPYTNSLILNNRVFVPIMNGSYDAAALQAYQDAMPGYEVVGVAGAASTPWESTDALHCRAHEIPDQNMLHISHMPYWGTLDEVSELVFSATVKAHSGQAVLQDSTFVAYKVNSAPWQSALLTHLGGNDYAATLSGFAPGDSIRYYIHAADASGRSISHPYLAALDPHVFTIYADTESPQITHSPLDQIGNEPAVFFATVTDNHGVAQVSLRYRVDDGTVNVAPFEDIGNNVWFCALDPAFNSWDLVFHYQIEASDTADSPNLAWYPGQDEWISVPIDFVANNDDLMPDSGPAAFAVYPNPFSLGLSSTLTIEYKMWSNLPPLLKIFNTKGQLVADIKAEYSHPDGTKYLWHGIDKQGRQVAPGIYFLRLRSESNSLTRKILILK
ncbi:MAG: agmatine deiminase family protein [Candidatus Syntrophosphaera sp.]|nr:agmatine deiminase family protein [Candidatus Syntrophosphaera sp.]